MSSTLHHRLSPRRVMVAALVSTGLAAAVNVAPASAATTNTVWCGGNCPAGAIQAAIDSTPSRRHRPVVRRHLLGGHHHRSLDYARGPLGLR